MIDLKNYSTYSKDFGFLKISEIFESDSTKVNGVAALVEDSTLYSSISFIEEAKKRKVKPIIGLTVHIGNDDKDLGTVTLFAKNQNGFNSLVNIVNSITHNKNEDSLVDIEHVIANNKDTILVIGSFGSLIYDSILNEDEDFIDNVVPSLKKSFGSNMFLEVLSSEFANHEDYNTIIDRMSSAYGIEKLATNNNKFAKKGHYKLFLKKAKATRKIQSKFIPSLYSSPCDYLKTVEQNQTVYFKDQKEACDNTIKIANEIGEYSLLKDDHFIPTFEKPLRDVLREKYHSFIRSKPENKIEEYKTRIQEELDVIEKLGFENYFLIFDDIIKNCPNVSFALRGSSISSLVTHMLGLSAIDPVENGLLFERFLNLGRSERKELPDIDLETDNPKEVVKYLVSKYGENRVVTLTAYSSMSCKRQLELAYETVKDDILEKPTDDNNNPRVLPEQEYAKLSDLIKFSFNSKDRNLTDELTVNRNLKTYISRNPEAAKLVKMGLLFEDQMMKANRSTASYAITPYDYKNIFSSYKAKDASDKLDFEYNVLEVGKENIEKIGLVKLDILSNKYLEKILNTCKKLNIDLSQDKKYECKEVYELLNAGYTTTLNQIKSDTQAQLCKDVGVENFNDIVNIMALLRPSVEKKDREDFVRTKKAGYKGSKILEPILGSTYGIIIFDEQVMKIGKEIGGFSPADADALRGALKPSKKDGKVDFEKIAEFKVKFFEGAAAKGIDKKDVESVFSVIENMAGKYTFSKSHSLAYAHLVYQQTWLKVNHPAEYFEFFLDKETGRKERLDYVQELSNRGVVLLPLDINRSLSTYKTRISRNGHKGVDYSLGSLFMETDDFSKLIVNERLANGAYENLYNFVERLLPKYSGISVYSFKWNEEPKIKTNFTSKVEMLIKMGAFDKLMPQGDFNIIEGRDMLKASLPIAIDLVLKPYIDGDFEYAEINKKIKPELYIDEEKRFYGGVSFAETKLITDAREKKVKASNQPRP